MYNSDEFLKAISIDYSNKEIQDIQGAVLELLTRIKDKINDRGTFKISHIQPCGSMKEQTSVWTPFYPGVEELKHKIEFDYLAVLEETSSPCQCSSEGCLLCMKVKGLPFNETVARNCHDHDILYYFKMSHRESDDRFADDRFADELYLWELWAAVDSFCGCFDGIVHKKDLNVLLQENTGCDKCTVYTPSGLLQIKALTDAGEFCSINFLWTSDSMSLYALEKFEYPYTYQTSQIKHLPVFIDFLPALELFKPNVTSNESEHDCFVVPKRCVREDECGTATWRRSTCLAEIDHVVKRMSDKHKRCFKILKYCTHQDFYLPGYHVKTAVLNHSLTCTDSSEDCQHCVIAILEELKLAYTNADLRSFSSRANLLYSNFHDYIDLVDTITTFSLNFHLFRLLSENNY